MWHSNLTYSPYSPSRMFLKKKKTVPCSPCCLVAKCDPFFPTPWAIAPQTLCPWDLLRQEDCSRLPFPFPGDLPNLGIKPESPALAGRFFTTEPPGKHSLARVCAKSVQMCLNLCDAMDCSLSGFSVHGILQARILEWVATSFFRGSSWPRDQTHFSYVSCTGGQVLYH